MYFDGSRTTIKAGVGIVLILPLGGAFHFYFSLDGSFTNNQAEYEALIVGLELLINMGVHSVHIKGDSQLVIHQVSGEFRCQNEFMLVLNDIVQKLLRMFDHVDVTFVPRFWNALADNLTQVGSWFKDEMILQQLTIE
ncbi:hypothetical protein Dimus_039309 [Dionaea muscipula]